MSTVTASPAPAVDDPRRGSASCAPPSTPATPRSSSWCSAGWPSRSEIGAIRAASGGTRLSLSREQQVLARFRDALGPDGAALGMMLLRQGRGRL